LKRSFRRVTRSRRARSDQECRRRESLEGVKVGRKEPSDRLKYVNVSSAPVRHRPTPTKRTRAKAQSRERGGWNLRVCFARDNPAVSLFERSRQAAAIPRVRSRTAHCGGGAHLPRDRGPAGTVAARFCRRSSLGHGGGEAARRPGFNAGTLFGVISDSACIAGIDVAGSAWDSSCRRPSSIAILRSSLRSNPARAPARSFRHARTTVSRRSNVAGASLIDTSMSTMTPDDTPCLSERPRVLVPP